MKTEQMTISTTDPNTDPDVVELREIHGRNVARVTATLADAVRAGELLTQRRAMFPARAAKGGGFADWVEQNLPYSRRTAWGYIRAYENRETLLTNPDATIRQLMGNKPTVGTNTPDEVGDDSPGDEMSTDPTATQPQRLNPGDEIIPLTETQRKRAQRLADYFGVELIDAQRYVRDTAPRKRNATAPTQPTTNPQLAKRTIRVTPDHDDLIHRVARTTNRSYAVVANELFEIGRKRFIRRYELTPE